MQGTAGVCLQDEIEMLVPSIELISQSMNKLPGMLVLLFSFGYCLYKENLAQRDAFL